MKMKYLYHYPNKFPLKGTLMLITIFRIRKKKHTQYYPIAKDVEIVIQVWVIRSTSTVGQTKTNTYSSVRDSSSVPMN